MSGAVVSGKSPAKRPIRVGKARKGKWSGLKALLIDIDNTIVRARNPEGCDRNGSFNTGSLMNVLHAAGVELGGLTPEETARRIERVQQHYKWWHWSDFIVELGLEPKTFWEYAYEIEREYIEPTGPEISASLERLQEAGFLLYVASNNPSSGILHKLRLAGIGHVNGSPLFSQLLGGTELHAMKGERIYWQKVLAHTGLSAREAAVIGDNPHDDFVIPNSVGIRGSFIIDRHEDLSANSTDCLIYVKDFRQIVDILLGTES
ncbi:MAG TPA: HAD family hydrolase [Phycisphaerae bacterium]|nr:HAD family hydrolase [Phycisphaerae bacterium]